MASHHSEVPTTAADKKQGEKLAKAIGDTYINFQTMPPIAQWTVIAKALRHNNMKITEKKGK
jgi:hypothetical protein